MILNKLDQMNEKLAAMRALLARDEPAEPVVPLDESV